MEVRFNFNLEAWMLANVEGDSLEECRDKLYRMSLEELLENGYVKESDIREVEEEIIKQSATVEVSNIEYDITEEDAEDNNMTVEQILDALPAEMTVEIKYFDPTKDDLEELINNEIELTTSWIAKDFNYKVVKEY